MQSHADLMKGNVWHGNQEPWKNWDILAGRFVSEFGMLACNLYSVDSYLTGVGTGKGTPTSALLTPGLAVTSHKDIPSLSTPVLTITGCLSHLPRLMQNHNKADGFERRLEVYLSFSQGRFSYRQWQLYLVENFKHSFEMERYVGEIVVRHITQTIN